MKKQILKYFIAAGVMASVISCSDFQEINNDPNAVPDSEVQIDFLLNRSIYEAQQNPHMAERAFILYWDRVSGYGARGGLTLFGDNGDWNNDYYGAGYLGRWLKDATLAITTGETRLADPTIFEEEKAQIRNVYYIAHIWRAYLYSEMSDNFGPTSISNYDGVAPAEMKSVADVYALILSQLEVGITGLDTDVALTDRQKKNDPFYDGDTKAWIKFANSLRMRYALRIGNQTVFEAAVIHPGGYIKEQSEIASVLEKGGWDPTTCVMSRTWNHQLMSRVYASLVMGLGGVEASQIAILNNSALGGIDAAVLAKYTKDPNAYLGIKMENYLATSTNRADAGYLFDAIPKFIDPRAMMAFSMPGVNNATVQTYPVDREKGEQYQELPYADSTRADGTGGALVPKYDHKKIVFRTEYTYHSFLPGDAADYGTNIGTLSAGKNIPAKSKFYRNAGSDNGNRRVFFGPWESYFLIAEAAYNGWSVGMSDQAAYEAGIAASFTFMKVGNFTGAYTASDMFNRNGTSVSYTHTTEASATPMAYYDLDDNLVAGSKEKTLVIKDNPTMLEVSYTYPKGAYATNNDKLTKIITQKYLANSPYLPLEAWSDYRRLNLPFMENPLVEKSITNMPWYTKAMSGAFTIQNVPQRLSYPGSLQIDNAAAYSSGVAALGGADEVNTPLSWAKKL